MLTKIIPKPILILISIWAGYLLILFILQKCHLFFGFHVWPMAEDMNWLYLMITAKGVAMMSAFWLIDDRNPLSPWWWYILSTKLQTNLYTLYYARKLIDPFLAIVTYLLLNRLGRKECQLFAFCVAAMVLIWNFSLYYNQIMWNFLGALGFTLLTLYFYCRYLDAQRKGGANLALALICYFVAFATYTLQSGAVIGIFLLSLFRDKDALALRLKNTFIDTGIFLILFILYNCIWFTVAHNSASYFTVHAQNFFTQLVISVREFMFHSSYRDFLILVIQDWALGISSIIFSITALIYLIIYCSQVENQVNIKIPTGWVATILLTIALPTMLVEATSQLWYPGSRSLMIQQVWQPLLYVSIIFLLAKLLAKNKPRLQLYIILTLMSTLSGVVVLVGFNYNSHLVLRTQYQKNFVNGVRELHIDLVNKPYLLVKTTRPDDKDLNTIYVELPDYGKALFQNQAISLRFISHEPRPKITNIWRVRFNEKPLGVTNGAILGENKNVPYEKLTILIFDGNTVTMPKKLSKEDFAGWQVDWNRTTPIYQTYNKEESK